MNAPATEPNHEMDAKANALVENVAAMNNKNEKPENDKNEKCISSGAVTVMAAAIENSPAIVENSVSTVVSPAVPTEKQDAVIELTAVAAEGIQSLPVVVAPTLRKSDKGKILFFIEGNIYL